MKTLQVTFLLAGALIGSLSPAFAAAQLRLTSGAATVTVLDNSPADSDPTPGIVTYVGPVGATWIVNVTSGLTKPYSGTAFAPAMHTSSVNVSSASSTITILFSDNDFQIPGALSTLVGGTTDGAMTFQVWCDSGNALFEQTTLVASLGPFGSGAFDGAAVGAVGVAAPYSVTLKAVMTHGPGSQVSSYSFPITIEPASDGGCRVTGGSNRQTNAWQQPFITAFSPLPTRVSHGGQVGAPFSVETEFTPNSPCIWGEWQHNRHLRGNSLVGTFHAASNGNKHQFDSLLCACLPCDESPGAVGVIGGLCNPRDRICGPEPRRAPANKICFSGVGDYTYTTGNKTVKAVFRVDIEDRSEGNSHASSPPPDRYRIRIWLLDPSLPDWPGIGPRSADPAAASSMAIRLAASADATKIASLATTEDLKVDITPDIDDGGDMTQGNHQLHPQTSAVCTGFGGAAPARLDTSTGVALATSTAAAPTKGKKNTTSSLLSFAIVAEGAQGTENPTFVYQTTITNVGSVALCNLSVVTLTDTNAQDTTAFYFAPGATLPPGGSVTRYYTNTLDDTAVISVVVEGTSCDDGTPAIAGSSAVAIVGLAGPTGLTARVTGTKIALSWSALTGASHYNVKRATASGGPYTTIGTATSTSYTDTGAKGNTYYYVVSAIKSEAETLNSNQVTAIVK